MPAKSNSGLGIYWKERPATCDPKLDIHVSLYICSPPKNEINFSTFNYHSCIQKKVEGFVLINWNYTLNIFILKKNHSCVLADALH